MKDIDEELEIIGEDDLIKKVDNINIEEEKPLIKKKTVKKKKLKKKLLAQTIFCGVSVLFIVGCFVFYGIRFFKYYRLFNPKTSSGKSVSLLSNYVNKNSNIVYEGSGAYKVKGALIYKGDKVDNYLEYSGLTWRIIKINQDNTIDLVLDDEINELIWDSEIKDFKDSDVSSYLNNYFIKYLNKDMLSKTTVCEDIINDITKISCEKTYQENYVRLLDINEYLNSKDESTYIGTGKNIWLENRGEESAWNINNDNVSYSPTDNGYLIKPVVTLKNTTPLISGKGTLEEPYVIEEKTDKVTVGKYVKIDNDLWNIYDIDDDKIYLSLVGSTNTYRFDVDSNIFNPEKEYSIGKYLNNEFYNSLSYKDLLLENEWNIGKYTKSYKDIESEKVKSKVGLLSITDLKFGDDTNYYLLNGTENGSIIYGEMLLESKTGLSRTIKPTISIKTRKLSGEGTKEKPFTLEA